jgi:tape measure domain-containing protein
MSSEVKAGKAFVEVGLRSKIAAGAKQIQREMTAIGSGLRSMGSSIAVTGATIGAGFGAILTGLYFPTKLAADAEMTQAAFEALLGSGEAAGAMIGDLRKFAAETPFRFDDVAKASTVLLAYGTSAGNVLPALKLLGDVSLGNQEKLDRLAVAFGQVQAKGRLMAQEVNQMVENGFNPLQEISRTSGKSMDELFKVMESGGIGFDMVVGAFQSATSEGGRFFNAMEKQSKTFLGQLSALADEVQQALLPIGQSILEFIKPAVGYLREGASVIKAFAPQLGSVAVALALVSAGGFVAAGAVTALGLAIVVAGSAASAVTALISLAMWISGLPVILLAVAAGFLVFGAMVASVGVGIGVMAGKAGLIGDAFRFISKQASELGAVVGKVFAGIQGALASGDYQLAGSVMMAGLKVVFLEGFIAIGAAINAVFDNAWSGIKRFFFQLAMTAWDVFTSLPKMLYKILTGANIGKMLSDAFAGRLDFGLNADALMNARKELDGLLKQVKPKESAAATGANAQFETSGLNGKTGVDKAKQAFDERVAALQKEIATLQTSADAAELAELKQKGLNDAQLAAVKALQDQRKAVEDEKKAREEADQKRKEAIENLRDEGKQLTESLRTPFEVLKDELRKNDRLQRGGGINEETRRRADQKAFETFQQQDAKQPADAKNAIAQRGSADALATLRRSLGLQSPRDWTQNLMVSAQRQLAATVQNTEAVGRLSERAFSMAGLERLTAEHIDETKKVYAGVQAVASAIKGNAVEVVTIG